MAVVIDNFRLQEYLFYAPSRRTFGDDPGKNDRLSDEDYRLPPHIR